MKNFNCFAYFEFNIDIDEVILSITSLDKDYIYNVYLKINIINMFSENKIEEQSKLSKPSKYNYDIQGKTNPLTSTLSLSPNTTGSTSSAKAIATGIWTILCNPLIITMS